MVIICFWIRCFCRFVYGLCRLWEVSSHPNVHTTVQTVFEMLVLKNPSVSCQCFLRSHSLSCSLFILSRSLPSSLFPSLSYLCVIDGVWGEPEHYNHRWVEKEDQYEVERDGVCKDGETVRTRTMGRSLFRLPVYMMKCLIISDE